MSTGTDGGVLKISGFWLLHYMQITCSKGVFDVFYITVICCGVFLSRYILPRFCC